VAFKTNSYTFHKLDVTDDLHQTFIDYLIRSGYVREGFSNFEEFLEIKQKCNLDTQLVVANSEDNLVGFFNIAKGYDAIYIDYIVSDLFRGIRDRSNDTVGSKMIREAKDYLLTTNLEAEFVKANLNSGNIRSIRALERAGFYHHTDNEYRAGRNL